MAENSTSRMIAEKQAAIKSLQAQLADPAKLQAEAQRTGHSVEDTRRGAEGLIARFNQEIQPLLRRQEDITAGQEFGKEVLGPEGLGRLKGKKEIEDLRSQFAQQLSQSQALARQGVSLSKIREVSQDPELAKIQQRLGAISEEGLSRKELQTQRELAFKEIGRATQTASRRAQALLAQAGVRGSVAGRQLLGLEQAGAEKKADVEQQLFLESEQIRRQALGDLAGFSIQRGQLGLQESGLRLQRETSKEQLEAARRAEARQSLESQAEFQTGVLTFDLGQAAREKDIILQSALGFAQIGQAERTGQAQAAAIAAQQTGCFVAGQMVEMADGSRKRIEQIVPGDELELGGKVSIVGWARENEVFISGDLRVTGDHAIHDGKGWVEAKHILEQKEVYKKPIKVYNLICENHILIVENHLVGDWFAPHEIDGLRGRLHNLKMKIKRKVKDSIKRLKERVQRLFKRSK